MIHRLVAPLFEPRFGMVFYTAVTSLLMAAHWRPMALPAVITIGLAVLRPRVAVRPVVWWIMAGCWLLAVMVLTDRMEDHVYLFTAWLVALAIVLRQDDDAMFITSAARQARTLVGIAFLAAVAWKVYFTEFLAGTSLWLYLVVDQRFQPLAAVLGLPQTVIEQDRVALGHLLDGFTTEMSSEASNEVLIRITLVALAALALEAVVAVAHLCKDSSWMAQLRMPALVLFAVLTYSVVPVLMFAALLALLTMVTYRWRREVMWVFPVLMMVPVTRLAFLSL